jgi:hypothetical protein
MKRLAVILLLSSCAQQKTVVVLPPATPIPNELLQSCNLDPHTPKSLPPIRSAAQIADSYNKLELSREAIIKQLNECDSKRSGLLSKLQETQAPKQLETGNK